MTETFDYIVVGAGSAGSALAAGLSENGRHSVLVLEAGGSDWHPYVRMPIGYGKVYYDARFNWKYLTEPVPGLDNKPSYWPRGRVLGGSSSINAMVYVRGHPADYAEWNAAASGWLWSDVEPIFRRMENWQGVPDPLRGNGGPLNVSDIRSQAHPLCANYLNAAREYGLPLVDDYNNRDMEGATHYQITTRNGTRESAARAYLTPARHRPNLRVRLQAQVLRVLLEGRTATGVEYRWRGANRRVRARAEIVLCGGAVNSPQLLQLSGIGPADVLRSAGVPVHHDVPAVGRHLADHLGADMVCRSTAPTLNEALRPWYGKLRAGVEYLLHRRGPLSLSLNQAGGFIRTDTTLKSPDLQLYFSPVSYTRAPPGTRPLINPDPFPGFLLGFNPCKPTSRGYLEIRSSDPLAAPLIQPDYLSTEYDRALMLAGMRLIRTLAAAPSFAAVIDREVYPGNEVQSDDDMMAFLAANAWTVFHPCGTCRMSDDASDSVVDGHLRVHGIDRLRVADASIFPAITTGNTNAPAIMVGERAACMIIKEAHSQ